MGLPNRNRYFPFVISCILATKIRKFQFDFYLRTPLTLAVIVLGCIALIGCTTLPEPKSITTANSRAIKFYNSHGALPPNTSKAILTQLEIEAGKLDILQKHLAYEQAINKQSPLVSGNKLVLLQDGPSTFKSMFAAIQRARDHINLETYIFEDGPVGERFVSLLLDKQAEGVQVNIIYDSVGSLTTPKKFFDRLSARGVRILEFNPINPLAPNSKTWRINNRDHRKLLIVDGQIAFVGGINISNTYSSGSVSRSSHPKKQPAKFGWRDTHVEIRGPVVAEFQKLFLDTWRRQQGENLAAKNYFPYVKKQGDDIVRAIGSVANDPDSPIYLTLLSAINHAEHRAYFTNAYFVPNPALLDALAGAAARGVDVKLILPSQSDSWIVFHAGRSHYTKLLRAGVKIYERKGTVMHAKTITIDGVWSTIGSTNLDWRSFVHNDEVNAVVLGHDFSHQMEAMFAQDLEQSDQVFLKKWQRRPFSWRLMEWASRLPEYWL